MNKTLHLSTLATALVIGAAAPPLAAQPQTLPPPPCEPGPYVVCNQDAPEDLVALGSDWVLAGAYSGAGGLRLVRVANRRSHMAYPAEEARHAHDTSTYPDCPGPPDTSDFTTHGVYVAPGGGPVHDVFVVGHGARESIEIFEIDTEPSRPAVTWVGCVVAPDPIGLNSVRGLADGGFITTNFLPRDGTTMQAVMSGEMNGELWEWHTETGWEEVPGSEASGANGLELSDDGETLYVAAWGSRSFFRLSRGETPPEREDIDLGFRIDNIHWADDGTLIGAGQVGQQRWKVVKIDPETLEVREILSRPDNPGFGAGTTAIEVGETLWVGSYRGNRIAIVPQP